MPATAEKAAPERSSDAIDLWCFRLESFAQRLFDDDISWSDNRRVGGEFGVARVLKDLAEGLRGVGETGPVGSPFEDFVNDNSRLLEMCADYAARVAADLEVEGEPVDAAACRVIADHLSTMGREWWDVLGTRETPATATAGAVDLEALRAWLLDSLRSSAADLDPCGPGNVEKVLHLDAASWSVSEAFKRFGGLADEDFLPPLATTVSIPKPSNLPELAQAIDLEIEGLSDNLYAAGPGPNPLERNAPVVHLDAASYAVERWLDRFEGMGAGSDA